MAGKFITKKQQEHIGKVLTGLVAALDSTGGGKWSKQSTDDIKLAYQMIGFPCPFETAAVKPEEPKPGVMDRVKGALGIKA